MSPTTTITCANHPDLPVASFCRTCGKPLCTACRRPVGGTVYCADHAPPTPASTPPPPYTPPINENPYTSPGAPRTHPMSGNSPAIAFLLGLIPGVGAIYNGQYAKGLVHAVFFGMLVTALSSRSLHGFEPLLGIMLGVFVFYMALEAYHTARKRSTGEPVEEFSSLAGTADSGYPIGAIVLIGLGFLLLLNTLDLISIDAVVRFWPVGLILVGVYMLYTRMRGGTQ
jgi:hypothetical protein